MFASKATRLFTTLAAAVVGALALCSPAWAWAWPADGPVLRGFSVSGDEYAAGQHRGIDIGLGTAASFRSPVSGTVTFAGVIIDIDLASPATVQRVRSKLIGERATQLHRDAIREAAKPERI